MAELTTEPYGINSTYLQDLGPLGCQKLLSISRPQEKLSVPENLLCFSLLKRKKKKIKQRRKTCLKATSLGNVSGTKMEENSPVS